MADARDDVFNMFLLQSKYRFPRRYWWCGWRTRLYLIWDRFMLNLAAKFFVWRLIKHDLCSAGWHLDDMSCCIPVKSCGRHYALRYRAVFYPKGFPIYDPSKKTTIFPEGYVDPKTRQQPRDQGVRVGRIFHSLRDWERSQKSRSGI